jgi:hypothetical protein
MMDLPWFSCYGVRHSTCYTVMSWTQWTFNLVIFTPTFFFSATSYWTFFYYLQRLDIIKSTGGVGIDTTSTVPLMVTYVAWNWIWRNGESKRRTIRRVEKVRRLSVILGCVHVNRTDLKSVMNDVIQRHLFIFWSTVHCTVTFFSKPPFFKNLIRGNTLI